MDQADIILNKAILLKDKLERLFINVNQARANIEVMIDKLSDGEISPQDYGRLPLGGTSDLVNLAHSADKTNAILEVLIFQEMDYRA